MSAARTLLTLAICWAVILLFFRTVYALDRWIHEREWTKRQRKAGGGERDDSQSGATSSAASSPPRQ